MNENEEKLRIQLEWNETEQEWNYNIDDSESEKEEWKVVHKSLSIDFSDKFCSYVEYIKGRESGKRFTYDQIVEFYDEFLKICMIIAHGIANSKIE
jgi:hypothetical protein